MNIETETGVNMNDPAVLDERIASVINTLIQVADPRMIVNALLGNAGALSQLIIKAGKASPAQVAQAFSSALVDALAPPEPASLQGESRIQIVPSGVLPRR